MAPSLCPLLALSPVPVPSAPSLPLPQLKILHIWMSVFSPSLSLEMGPPPSPLHPSSCWMEAGGALFTYYLFKSSHLHFRGSHQCVRLPWDSTSCLQTCHLNIFNAFDHLQNSILLLLSIWKGEDQVRKMKKCIFLFYFPLPPVLAGEYWRPDNL